MNPVVEIFVLLAVGAIVANVIAAMATSQGSGFFGKANGVWKWAITNAYGQTAAAPAKGKVQND